MVVKDHDGSNQKEGTIIAALLVGFIARLFGKHLGFIKAYRFPEEQNAEQSKASDTEDIQHKNVIVIGRQYGSGGTISEKCWQTSLDTSSTISAGKIRCALITTVITQVEYGVLLRTSILQLIQIWVYHILRNVLMMHYRSYYFPMRFSSGNTVHSIVIKHRLPPMILDTGSARNTPSVPICKA